MSIRADVAEAAVLDAIKALKLTPEVIDESRRELGRRLAVPDGDLVGAKRRRLEGRLDRLKKQFSWGEP